MPIDKALILSAIIASIVLIINIVIRCIYKRKNGEDIFDDTEPYFLGCIWLIVFAISLTCFILYNQYTQI